MNDPFIVYYSSPSGNTQKFVEKLDIANSRIPHNMQEDLFINVPYVLITPTYGGLTNKNRHSNAVPKQVVKFLNYTNNRLGIRGVIASGNANFGIEYGLAGEVISRKCMVPYLYRFELMGTVEDVLCVRQGLRQLWQDNLKNNEKILPSVAI